MTWNYRVLEWTDREEGKWQSIHEVYYDENGSLSAYTCDPAEVMSSDPAGNEADLAWVLDRMREALAKPVLTADDFPEPPPAAPEAQPERSVGSTNEGRDAARYRWLREQKYIDIGMAWFVPLHEQEELTPDGMDAAIDAAMAEGLGIESPPPEGEPK